MPHSLLALVYNWFINYYMTYIIENKFAVLTYIELFQISVTLWYNYENKWGFSYIFYDYYNNIIQCDLLQQQWQGSDEVETFANFPDKIFSHRGPWTINGRLQLLYTAVANFTGLALNISPDAVVEGVQVRRLWRPEILGPKVHVWPPPLLNNVWGVRRSTILLEYVVCISSYFLT